MFKAGSVLLKGQEIVDVPPIARVDYVTLRAFLAADSDALWLMRGPRLESGSLLHAVNTDTLMSELEPYFNNADEMGYLYVFSDEFPVADAMSEMGDRPIRTLTTPNELSQYRAGSNDYLYLSPSLEEASGDMYITVLVGD